MPSIYQIVNSKTTTPWIGLSVYIKAFKQAATLKPVSAPAAAVEEEERAPTAEFEIIEKWEQQWLVIEYRKPSVLTEHTGNRALHTLHSASPRDHLSLPYHLKHKIPGCKESLILKHSIREHCNLAAISVASPHILFQQSVYM